MYEINKIYILFVYIILVDSLTIISNYLFVLNFINLKRKYWPFECKIIATNNNLSFIPCSTEVDNLEYVLQFY